MVPALNRGDLILIKACNSSQLLVGDIIVFNAPKPYDLQNPIVHRIVRIWDDNGQRMFQTRGDNNFISDPYEISASAIVGQFTNFKIAYVGLVFLFLRTPIGLGFIISGVAIWAIYDHYKKALALPHK